MNTLLDNESRAPECMQFATLENVLKSKLHKYDLLLILWHVDWFLFSPVRMTGSRTTLWNKVFQETLEMEEENDKLKLHKYNRINEIASDFIYAAEMYVLELDHDFVHTFVIHLLKF
jgi:hypothetical protein